MRKWVLLAMAFTVGCFVVILYKLCPANCFSFTALKMHRAVLQQNVVDHYWYSITVFLALYTIMVALSLPVATLMTVAGGMLFGTEQGIVLSVLGGTIGSVLAFFAVRYVVGDWLQERYKVKLHSFNEQMHHYGAYYLLALHFVAVIPFTFINLLAGLTNVHWWTFVWTTAVGMLPMSVLYAMAGQELNCIHTITDLFSFKFIFIILLLVISALLPALFKYMRRRWR